MNISYPFFNKNKTNCMTMKKEIRSTLLFFCSIVLINAPCYGQIQFEDATEEAGIDHYFEVFQGTFGGGGTVLDYDLDGHEDIFLAGGAGKNILYKNNGDGTFTDVTESAGLDVISPVVSQGAASADVNRDGYPDLFVTTITRVDSDQEEFAKTSNIFFINQGNGTFSDQSVRYGLADTPTFSTGASFGDFNKDGLPDLYVSNYFKDFSGRLDEFGGPTLGETGGPDSDLLYINVGGIEFREVSQEYGMAHTGLGFQGVWTDFDNDNDLDLIIANDFGDRATPNLLYRNEFPEPEFTEVGTVFEADYQMNAMGIAIGDVNMDGWLDYFITNISESPLLVNQGDDQPFVNQSRERGTSFRTLSTDDGLSVITVSWGANFFDVDNDMDVDLYVTNGSLNPGLAPNPNLMLENENGNFENVAFFSDTNDHSFGRGSLVFDYDSDGDLDLLIINQTPHTGEQPDTFEAKSTRLYKNTTQGNNWLRVKLNGDESDTNGIGTMLKAYVDGKVMVREVHAGSSHESQNSLIAHFGLGDNDKLDSLRIRWNRGREQLLENVEANQLLQINEEDAEGSSNEPSGPIPGPNDKIQIQVYPVPFDDRFKIVLNEQVAEEDMNEFVYLVLTNISGHSLQAVRILKSQLLGEGYEMVLNSSIAQGVYVLFIEIGGETTEKKLYAER